MASNKEINKAKDVNFLKKRGYKESEISKLSDQALKETVKKEQRAQFKEELEKDNENRPREEKYLDQFGKEQTSKYPKLSKEEIDAKVDELMAALPSSDSNSDPFSKEGTEESKNPPSESEGGGKPLEGEKAAFPAAAGTDINAQVAESVAKQIRETIPPIVPISMQSIGSMFLEPLSRQAFCLIYFSPVGFFYVAIHTPCFYPIILPAVYPVIPMGPPPAGFIALGFSAYATAESFDQKGSGLEYCGGSAPIEDKFWNQIEVPKQDFLKQVPPLQPCDPRSPLEVLKKCAQSNDKIAKQLMGQQPMTPELANIIRLIEKLQVVTQPEPSVQLPQDPQQVVDIFVTDDFEDLPEINISPPSTNNDFEGLLGDDFENLT